MIFLSKKDLKKFRYDCKVACEKMPKKRACINDKNEIVCDTCGGIPGFGKNFNRKTMKYEFTCNSKHDNTVYIQDGDIINGYTWLNNEWVK